MATTMRDKFDAMVTMQADPDAHDAFVAEWQSSGDTDAAYRAALAHRR